LVHDDGAVLDLDAAVRRRGLAVERPVLVLPAGQVLAVEQAGVALLRLLRVVGLPAGHAAGQAQRQPQRYQPAPLEAHHTALPKTVFLNDLEGTPSRPSDDAEITAPTAPVQDLPRGGRGRR